MKQYKPIYICACMLGVLILIIGFAVFSVKNYRDVVGETPPEKTKIRFLSEWGNSGAKGEVLADLLDEYMRGNETVDIVNESIAGSQFEVKLLSDFASGYYPDIIAMRPGREMEKLYDDGKIISFTDVLDSDYEWMDTIDKSMLRYITRDQEIYGIPTDAEYICMYVNSDLFRQYQIRIPESYEELKAVIPAFKKNGIIPIAFAGGDHDLLLYQALTVVIGGNIEIKNSISQGAPGSAYTDAFECIRELKAAGAFSDDCMKQSREAAAGLFIEKGAAMIVETSDFVQTIEEAGDNSLILSRGKSVEMIAFPGMDAAANQVSALPFGAGEKTYYISSSSDKKSIDIVKFLSSPEAAIRFSNMAKTMTTTKTYAAKVADTGLSAKREMLLMSAGEFARKPIDLFDISQKNKYIIRNFEDIILGKKPADEVMKSIPR